MLTASHEASSPPGDLSRHLVRYDAGQGAEMPAPSRPAWRRWLFIGLFVLPVMAALLYNFVLATPRYASDMSFVVRSPAAARDRLAFLNVTKANGQDESEAIVAYIRSRELLAAIDHDGLVSREFAGEGVDVFSAFPGPLTGTSREDFHRHVQRFVRAEFDRGTGITTVEVQAFDPAHAREIARRILTLSEAMVNRLNARPRAGLIASAQEDVRVAALSLDSALRRLGAARARRGVLEPALEAGAAIRLSSASEAQLAAINVELAQVSRAAPRSPVIGQLRARRAALLAEIARQAGGQTGGPNTLANRMQDIERARAEVDIAEKRLLAASIALVSARSSADRQRLYVERIAAPSLPDEPWYPRAWVNTALTALIAACILWIALSLAELVADDD